MAMQTWQTLVNAYQFSGENTGAEYKESTTATDVSPGGKVVGQALAIPANFLIPGNILRFTAAGIYSTTVKPKLVLGIYWGGVGGKALAVTPEMEPATETVTNQTWRLEATTRIKEVGETGKALTLGYVMGYEHKSSGTEAAGVTMMPAESATGGESEAINTGEAKILTLGATWKTSSASNKLFCYQWLVEVLN